MRDVWDIAFASSGDEALTILDHKPMDVIVSDLRMPEMDGITCIEEIAAYDPNAKIIFITAFSVDDKKTEKAKKMGLLELLHKPIEFKQIVKIIQKYA